MKGLSRLVSVLLVVAIVATAYFGKELMDLLVVAEKKKEVALNLEMSGREASVMFSGLSKGLGATALSNSSIGAIENVRQSIEVIESSFKGKEERVNLSEVKSNFSSLVENSELSEKFESVVSDKQIAQSSIRKSLSRLMESASMVSFQLIQTEAPTKLILSLNKSLEQGNNRIIDVLLESEKGAGDTKSNIKSSVTNIINGINSGEVEKNSQTVMAINKLIAAHKAMEESVITYMMAVKKLDTLKNQAKEAAIYAKQVAISASLIKSLDTDLQVGIKKVGASAAAVLMLAIVMVIYTVINGSANVKAVTDSRNKVLSRANEKQEGLRQLLDQIAAFEKGDLTIQLGDSDQANKQVVAGINSAISRFRNLINEAQGMMVDISSASEQSIRTAQQVEESKTLQQEMVSQSSAIASAVKLSAEKINNEIKITEDLASDTKRAVEEGGSAIRSSHEGVVGLGRNLVEIMNTVKTMLEGVQSLQELTVSIKEVSDRVRLLSFNTQLLSGRITGEDGVTMANTANEMEVCHVETSKALTSIGQAVERVIGLAANAQGLIENGGKSVGNIVDVSDKAYESLEKIAISANKVLDQSKSVTGETNSLNSNTFKIVDAFSNMEQVACDTASASSETSRAIGGVNNKAEKLSALLSPYIT